MTKQLKSHIGIIFLACLFMLIGCGSKESLDTSMLNTTEMNTEGVSDVSTEVSNKELEGIKFILGKWEILETTGSGYIYSDQYLESDIIGGIITIQEEYIDANLPYKKARLENPNFQVEKQDRDEFVSWTKANFKSFGFEKETGINFVRVYGNSNEDDCESPDGRWCVTGGTFWIRDKEHLIFTGPGPLYYLAQKVD